MKLYHLSGDINNLKEKRFIPRIPDCMMENENKTIKRICFSDNILGCLRALPEEGNGIGSKANNRLRRGIPIVYDVYTIEVDNNINTYSPEYLNKKGYVKDSLLTKEYWILEEVIAKKEFRIEIIDIQFDKSNNEIIKYIKRTDF